MAILKWIVNAYATYLWNRRPTEVIIKQMNLLNGWVYDEEQDEFLPSFTLAELYGNPCYDDRRWLLQYQITKRNVQHLVLPKAPDDLKFFYAGKSN